MVLVQTTQKGSRMYFKIGQHVRIAKKVREQKENNGSDYRYFEKVIFEVLREPYGDFGDVRVRVVSNEKITKSLRGGCGADSFVICGSIPIPENSLVGAEYNFIESALEPWIYVAPAVKRQICLAFIEPDNRTTARIETIKAVWEDVEIEGVRCIVHPGYYHNKRTGKLTQSKTDWAVSHYRSGQLMDVDTTKAGAILGARSKAKNCLGMTFAEKVATLPVVNFELSDLV